MFKNNRTPKFNKLEGEIAHKYLTKERDGLLEYIITSNNSGDILEAELEVRALTSVINKLNKWLA